MSDKLYRDVFGATGSIQDGEFVPYASQKEADAKKGKGAENSTRKGFSFFQQEPAAPEPEDDDSDDDTGTGASTTPATK